MAKATVQKKVDDKQLREWLSSASTKLTPQNLTKASGSMLVDLQRKISHWQAEVNYYVQVKATKPTKTEKLDKPKKQVTAARATA